MADIEALKLTLKQVEEAAAAEVAYWAEFRINHQPRSADIIGWDQGAWFHVDQVNRHGHITDEGLETDPWCVTAGCFAGHYAISQGFTKVIRQPRKGFLPLVLLQNAEGEMVTDGEASEGFQNVAAYTRKSLGLTQTQANVLFNAGNTLDDLRFYVEQICEGDDLEAYADQM